MPSIHPLSSRHAQHRVEAKYNVVTEYPNLRLHGAAAKGDIGLVQYALTHGQPANSVLDGILPLHAACSGGSELVVKLLIDFGADVNAPRLPRRYTDKRTEGGTIIGSSGSTPLHFAAANGHASIVKILLQRGADPLKTDKHGTKPETLAINFGHDEVASVLREWEAAHRPPEASGTNASGGASVGDGPPSPSRSRKLQVKRSLENLLSRKGHGMTPAQPPAGPNTLPPLNVDPSSLFATYHGHPTSSSAVTELFGSFPGGSRRPSLPHIFESSPPSPTKKRSHRPQSAGEEQSTPSTPSNSHSTLPGSGQKRLGSKISLLNIFKKSSDHTPTPNPLPLGGAYGASSPNLLAPLQASPDTARYRARSSTEELRSPGSPRGSLDRERRNVPTTAPVHRTAFFGHALNQLAQLSDDVTQPSLPPPVITSRPPRSHSQPRPAFGVDLRPRADSSTTVSSSGSSLDQQTTYSVNPAALQSMALHNRARSKRDRSASEGAGALGKRSPLMMTEWIRDEDGNVVRRELPGVIADDDEGDNADGGKSAVASPEQLPSVDLARQTTSPRAPRRPSLTNGAAGGDSSGSLGHNRSSSTQSTKNLRFDLPASESPKTYNLPNVTSPVSMTSAPMKSPAVTSPLPVTSNGARPQKGLRNCASAGSLAGGRPRQGSRSSTDDRQANASNSENSNIPAADADTSVTKPHDSDEECIAAEAAEGADYLGEPVWNNPGRTTYSRTGSMNSGYVRPNITSPVTPASASGSLFFSPMSTTTTSSGGRPWALPDSVNGSQSSLATPAAASGPGGKVSVVVPNSNSTPTKPSSAKTEADSRMRGASISSSKSTDTTASSINPATASSSNVTSDSSGPHHNGPNWSTTNSTVSVGTTGKGGTVRANKLSPITTSAGYRFGYEIDEYDSSSSDKGSRTSPPLPVLLRTVNSHAQAHALVEKAQKDILDLADLPPDSGGLTGEFLSAQLAAYGETLALERRFAKGEAQKTAWLNRKTLEDDSDEGDLPEEDSKYPRGMAEAFVAPVRRKPSSGGVGGNPNSTSPTLQRAGSVEFGAKGSKGRTHNRMRSVRARQGGPPTKSQTSPPLQTTPIRTTPSNVGPPVSDFKTSRRSSDDPHLNHLILHGIEITKTLPTPTDSPHSPLDLAAISGRNVGVDEATESPTLDSESPPHPSSAPIARSRTPEVTVSDFQPVPLSRVSTAPSAKSGSEKTGSPTGHGRTASAGANLLLGGLDGTPPRSESRMAKRFGGLKSLVHTLTGKS